LNKEIPQDLKYFDAELFYATEAHTDLDIFQCPICLGVVIKPLECTTPSCASLYCEACLAGMKEGKKCPKRCGSYTFQQPHKFVMKQLNELKFKCQNNPWCKEILPYIDFRNHAQKCKISKKKIQELIKQE